MLNLRKKTKTSIGIVTFSILTSAFTMSANALTYDIPDGYTTITDPNFYNCVATEFKDEFPSEEIPVTGLTDEQLGNIQRLVCGYESINNTVGLEKMINLTRLYLPGNNLSEIDVTKNVNLEELTLYENNLSEIDVSKNVNLSRELDLCDNNFSEMVDISNNTQLRNVYMDENTIFDFSSVEQRTFFEFSAMDQKKTIETNSLTYILPDLFTEVKTQGWGPGLRYKHWGMYTDLDFTLENATLSADGKSITIIDPDQPASIMVNGGLADGSKLTVIYKEAPEPDPVVPDTSDDTKAPDTGSNTNKKGDISATMIYGFVLFVIPICVILLANYKRKKKGLVDAL